MNRRYCAPLKALQYSPIDLFTYCRNPFFPDIRIPHTWYFSFIMGLWFGSLHHLALILRNRSTINY
jgi:hypothetical protein